jgi:heme-degrading monooxygenase HmoA
MFAVMYRWWLKPGTEAAFRKAWRSATESIRAKYGTYGSRLHHADDEYPAYALWPSRERWKEAKNAPSANPDAANRMRAYIEESFATTPLDVLDDLLCPLPTEQARS